MRKLVVILASVLVWLGCETLLVSPAAADLEVSIRGQIRFNTIYADQIYGSGQTIPPGDIRFDSGSRADRERDHDQTIIDARRTRLWLDISDTIPGDIKLAGKVQVDFNTDDGNAKTSNSRHLRLRLAYAQATTPRGFTVRAGQVRTILSEFGDNLIGGVADPEVVNENGHFNQLQAREPAIQVAWTGEMGDGDFTVGAAVEKQGVDVNSRTGLGGVREDQGEGQDIPLFGGGVRYRSPFFSIFARGAGAKARVILSTTGKDREEAVWLGAVGAEVKPTKMLKFVGQYWRSHGLNRINATVDDVVLTGGRLNAVEAQAVSAGAQLKLTENLRFNAVYEWLEVDEDARIFDLTSTSSDKETFQGIHVNAIYKFWVRWDTGLEYMYGKVESFGDSEGDINVVNFRLRFYF